MPTTLTVESNCGSTTDWLDRDLRRQVEDDLGLGIGEQGHQIGVDDVGLRELERRLPLGRTDVRAAARAEVIDADDVVAVRQQPVYQRGSDESGCAGDECPHRLTIPMAAERLPVQSGDVNRTLRIAVALIALQLVIRAVLAWRGYFYWDDLILTGRAGTQGLLSPSYLFDDHDGHVMPAAFLVAGGITRLAPLNWIGPAISLVVLQLVASLALLRALHVILGWRPVLLVPLTFALFTPLGVPAFAWWAAALNSLPMLAALAWVCADAILLVRTGNQRYAATGVLAFLVGLLFFEKAAVIPFVAFAVAALLAHVTGDGSAVRTVWRRGLRLWTASLALVAAWVAAVPRRRRPAAVELRSGHDVGSAEPLGDPRHHPRPRGRTVGLAALGARLAVGDPARRGNGAGLGGAGGGGGGVAGSQGADRPGVGRGAWAMRSRARCRST